MKTILLTALGATLLQGCIVYDESLFEGSSVATGGDGAGTGGDTSTTGGTASGGLGVTGGGPGSGGGTTATGGAGTGGVATGGTATGGTSTGGAATGGSGSGGTCTIPAKATEDLSAYTVLVIDNFDTEWRKFSNDTLTGDWYAAGDLAGSGLQPDNADWKYADLDCGGSGEDLALHATGTGYTTWGVSMDATLMNGGTAYNASTYTGVTFRARSDDGDVIKVAFKDTLVTDSIDTSTKKLGNAWTRYYLAFPGGIDASKLKTISIVGINEPTTDFMIDDFGFYDPM